MSDNGRGRRARRRRAHGGSRRRARRRHDARRFLAARVAFAAVVLTVFSGSTLVACSANPSRGPETADTGGTIPDPTDDPTAAPDAVATSTTDAPVTKTVLTRTLNKGDKGDDVKMVQQRLKDLAFDPGPKIDGIYGEQTAQAVWAYKALILGERWDENLSSRITPDNWTRMQDPLNWIPRKQGDTPRHLEVYLPEQVAVLVTDGNIKLITHVSTGNGKWFCNKRRPLADVTASGPTTTVDGAKYCNFAVTPAGVYRFWAKRDGIYQGYYGDLFKPTFFNGGIAVHGFDNVPAYPASHGCVRIPNHVAEYFQSLVRVGDQVFVFDGTHDPDALGAVLAPPDELDPSSTSTTSTTAKPTTTVAATTTVAKATTTASTAVKPTTATTSAATTPAATTAVAATTTTIKK